MRNSIGTYALLFIFRYLPRISSVLHVEEICLFNLHKFVPENSEFLSLFFVRARLTPEGEQGREK